MKEQVIEKLRSIHEPKTGRDIVSLGIVRDVSVTADRVTVTLAPESRDPAQMETIMSAIRSGLATEDPVRDVRVVMEPARPGIAPEAGYREEGPEPLPGPASTAEFVAALPVIQWEIRPDDPALAGGETEIDLDGWEYRMWWKIHPAELIYACIEAVHAQDEDERPGARRHPIGRNAAVMLVYDQRRHAVIAVHGLARDFRPFIEAFHRGCPALKSPSTGDPS